MTINTTPFFWGTIALFIATIVFYIIFASLAYYWHEKKASFVVVPLMYTFEFFLTGFLIVSLTCLLLQYLPEIIAFINSSR